MQEPIHVQIQTTTACNGRCLICPHPETWGRQPTAVMEDAAFARILDELEGVRIGKLLMYLENEPLLDPALWERLAQARQRLRFQALEVATNAAALTPAVAERLVSSLAGVKSELRISFHGVDARTHEGCMGLDFETCLRHVVHVLHLVRTTSIRVYLRGAGEPHPLAAAHPFTFSKAEYHAFWERICEAHAVARRPRIDFIRYHDRARNIRRGPLRAAAGSPARTSLRGFRCIRTERWLHFLHSGELTLCCMDYHREAVFGDIRTDSLESILTSPAWARLRAQVHGEAESPPDFLCKRCISPGG